MLGVFFISAEYTCSQTPRVRAMRQQCRQGCNSSFKLCYNWLESSMWSSVLTTAERSLMNSKAKPCTSEFSLQQWNGAVHAANSSVLWVIIERNHLRDNQAPQYVLQGLLGYFRKYLRYSPLPHVYRHQHLPALNSSSPASIPHSSYLCHYLQVMFIFRSSLW